MGAPLSAYAEALVLNALLPTAGGQRYLSLHSGNPGSNGTNEITGGSYARQEVTWEDVGSDPTTRQNDSDVQFPTASASWGSITHFGIWDAATNGNFIGGGILDETKVVNENDSLRFPAGSLIVTVD